MSKRRKEEFSQQETTSGCDMRALKRGSHSQSYQEAPWHPPWDPTLRHFPHQTPRFPTCRSTLRPLETLN